MALTLSRSCCAGLPSDHGEYPYQAAPKTWGDTQSASKMLYMFLSFSSFLFVIMYICFRLIVCLRVQLRYEHFFLDLLCVFWPLTWASHENDIPGIFLFPVQISGAPGGGGLVI
jgi:hypothetical protein